MRNRIPYLAAVFLMTFLMAGCRTDRALILTSREEPADDVPVQTQERVQDKAEMIYVHVCGAVQNPAVVELPAGSRGESAVLAAGGFTADAAQSAVNLARELEDGMQLYIPTMEEAQTPDSAIGAPDSGRININRADAAQLCTLPGIGETRAEAIIADRDFNGAFERPEDIMRVSGIKESTYEKIKDKITVR